MTANDDKPGESTMAERGDPLTVKYFVYLLLGIGFAAAWTALGSGIAFVQQRLEHFLFEWESIQAFFCIAVGAWLLLIARSGSLFERALKITQSGSASPQGLIDRRLRILIVLLVWIGGTISIIGMGFNADGVVLWFMWLTSALVCFAAGIVTLHAIDLLLTVHNLQTARIKVFSYSPARTPELRDIISYFTLFTLILSIGYAFAFAGTLRGHWTGSPIYVEAVQLFWPMVYVPVCSIALIYPHVVVHGIIQKTKERALLSYQREIDGLLAKYQNLQNDEVQRINTLAQVFDRISSTPNYVIDMGIALRTALPLVLNLAIFAAKPLMGQS